MISKHGFYTVIVSPDVRIAIIAEWSSSVVEFWYASGRADRDGKIAYVNFLY